MNLAEDLLRLISGSTSKDSIAEVLASLPQDQLDAFMAEVAALPEKDQVWFANAWEVWGRPAQHMPDFCDNPKCGCEGNWSTLLWLCGRGWGKTRALTEAVHKLADEFPTCRIAMVAPTAGDVRRVLIEGESGLLATAKPWLKCEYEPSKVQVVFENGSLCSLYSADEPRRMRGPQHHFAVLDEIAAWDKPDEMMSMIRLGLRLPRRAFWKQPYRPRMIIATTPLPTPMIRRLAGVRPFEKNKRTHVVWGSTKENKSNLDQDFFDSIVADLEGTRLGRQELGGEILEDAEGALFRNAIIDPFRVRPDQIPPLKRIVVGVDPAVGGDNATGIVVVGVGPKPLHQAFAANDKNAKIAKALARADALHGYVLADLSVRGNPDVWGRTVIAAYHDYECDDIVAESNQGGDLILHTLRQIDGNVKVKMVRAHSRKEKRAEPYVALAEQGRIHLVGKLPDLESEMLTWDPNPALHMASPDRLDAMVWGLHSVMGRGKINHSMLPVTVPKGLAKGIYGGF